MCLLKLTNEEADLKEILDLQQENLPGNISPEEKSEQGFVTVHHTLEQLQQMAAYAPQVVAIEDGRVVGYVLSMVAAMRDEFPEIAPMFDLLPDITYKGQSLAAFPFIVCGQACVAKSHRGKGLVGALYREMKKAFFPKYTLCITEVASANIRSLRAHEKVGFRTVKVYNDGREDWELVVWDFRA